jgi:hypothetical protein
MYRVRAHTPFPQGLQLGLHLAKPGGNLLWVLLHAQCDSRATAFYALIADHTSSASIWKYIIFDIFFQLTLCIKNKVAALLRCVACT